jgi:hypothetical protein
MVPPVEPLPARGGATTTRFVSSGRPPWTGVVAVLLLAVGFTAGAAGSAWVTRARRADPWRKLHVDQEGFEGTPTKTRVVFDNPNLPLQAVEVVRSADGQPVIGRVVLRDGQELTARYEGEARPASIEASDRSKALIGYGAKKARVDLFGANGKAVGTTAVTVPVELRSALRLASVWDGALIGEAAAAEEDPTVTVQRNVDVGLDIRLVGSGEAGRAQIEASCPPFACLPVTPDVAMPGRSLISIAVTGSTKKSRLGKSPDAQALEPFLVDARNERRAAARRMPDVSAVVAAVGLTALACSSLQLTLPICVGDLGKRTTSTAAIDAIAGYAIEPKGPVVDDRAAQLYLLDQARATLDSQTRLELCVSRDGYTRVCTEVQARPFGPEAMAVVERSVEMRRGIGGTLVGSFVFVQSDGADCKFSPSPRTTGALRLTFDNEKNVMTGSMKTEERGTRPNLGCSAGTGNMSWSQSYNITVTQQFTAPELQSGGKLPLHAKGTMNGLGSYSFSNCRSRGGASANCPAGKNEGYSYPVELTGELDLATQTGAGSIVVSNAPLSTLGSWRIPAEKVAP